MFIVMLSGRPTEIAEKDIYLNEARYDEEEGQFRKLKGLKVSLRTVSLLLLFLLALLDVWARV